MGFAKAELYEKEENNMGRMPLGRRGAPRAYGESCSGG